MAEPSLVAYVGISLLLFVLSAFGSLAFVHPQLAFRLENIFQLREVELTDWGVVVNKLAGALILLTVVSGSLLVGQPWMLVPASIGAAIPPLYCYRQTGQFVVEPILGSETADELPEYVNPHRGRQR